VGYFIDRHVVIVGRGVGWVKKDIVGCFWERSLNYRSVLPHKKPNPHLGGRELTQKRRGGKISRARGGGRRPP